MSGGGERRGQHPRHDGRDLRVVAQWVEAWDGGRARPFGNDQVGQDAQGAAQPVQGVGACGVGWLDLWVGGQVGGFDAVPAAVEGRG